MSIKGMHCASCALTIEKSLKKVSGVVSTNVNFASEKAVVEFDSKKTNKEELVNAVKNVGYDVILEQDNIRRITLRVRGMSSQHCAGVVENSLKKLAGIKIVDVSFAIEKAIIEYDQTIVSLEQIKKTISDAGYEPDNFVEIEDREKLDREKEINSLKIKFFISLAFSVPLLYFVMSPMIGLPLPKIKPLIFALIQFALTTPIMIVFQENSIPAKTADNEREEVFSLIVPAAAHVRWADAY